MWSYRFLEAEENKEEEKVEKPSEEKPKIVEVVKREGRVLTEVVSEPAKKERKHLFKKKEKVEKIEEVSTDVEVHIEDVLKDKE